MNDSGETGHEERLPRLYDRDGEPIDFAAYVSLLTERPGYEEVAAERVGPYWVSTTWIGTDPRRDPQAPAAVFETMVFLADLDETGQRGRRVNLAPNTDARRYANEAEAWSGHQEVVSLIRAASDSAASGGAHRRQVDA